METTLLITSIILFHLPSALYKDTIRRFQRMEQYNSLKATDYEYDNGSLNDYSLSTILYLSSSFIFALIPLIGGLGINWFLAIILNIVLSLYVIPFIAFLIYPANLILSKRSLKVISLSSVIIACIFWGIYEFKAL